jgi:hypothetical protein
MIRFQTGTVVPGGEQRDHGHEQAGRTVFSNRDMCGNAEKTATLSRGALMPFVNLVTAVAARREQQCSNVKE